MEALLNILNSVRPLSDDAKAYLGSNIKYRKLKVREYLLQKGEVCSEICFINKGLLHCYYPHRKKKVTSWFMKEADVVISVSSFYFQTPSLEFIQALEETELYYITHRELYTAYDKFHDIDFVGRELTQNYYALMDQQRLQLVIGSPREKLEWFQLRYPDLLSRVPLSYVATFLGVSRETLTRVRS